MTKNKESAEEGKLSSGDSSSTSLAERCHTSMELLMSSYDIKPADPCPVCGHKVGFHLSRAGTSQSGPTVKHNDGSKSTLPQWGTDYKVVKLFIEKFERVLISDLVSEDHWPRLLLKATPNANDGYFVMKHIVDAGLKWSDAKKLFTNHFESYAYQQKLELDYERIKQQKEEPVQRYTDRFSQLLDQLGYQHDEPFVLRHYLNSLLPSVHANFLRHTEAVSLLADKEIKYESFRLLSDKLIRLEAIELNHGAKSLVTGYRTNNLGNHSDSSQSNSSSGGGSNSNNKTIKKQCTYHPHATNHTTADCFNNPDNKRSSLSQGASGNNASTKKDDKPKRDISEVRCHVCKNMGHYANDPKCPQYSDRSIRSTASSSANNSKNAFGNKSSGTTNNASSSSSSSSGDNVSGKSSTVCNDSIVVDRTIPQEVFNGRRLDVMVATNGCLYSTLVDTGASVSFIDSALVNKLGLAIIPPSATGKVLLAHAGSSVPRSGKATIKATYFFPGTDHPSVDIEHTYELMQLHSDSADYHITVGKDLICRLFPEYLPRGYYNSESSGVGNPKLRAASTTDDKSQSMVSLSNEPDVIMVETSNELQSEYTREREKLLNNINGVLNINAKITGFCNVPEAMVTLSISEEYEKKLYRKQYPIAHSLIDPTTKVINRWFEEGKTCYAPPGCRYNNPITVALKKDDNGNVIGVRPCLDVRMLNKALVVDDRFQIPHIRESLESFAGNSIFSEFDLQEAFLQFPLNPESRQYTAFTWAKQQYMFVGCPYGLTLLTSHFQRIMTRIFSDLTFCAPYIDNIPFASKDWENHTLCAIAIVDRLTKVNLKLKPNFTKIGHSHLKCLGHVISKDGISIDPVKLEAIKDWTLPTTGKELRSFLGLCSFIRQHVRHYAELATPLEAVYNESELKHTDEFISAFNTLKKAIASSPILHFPDFSKPFHIATDASQTGVGGVLFQPSCDDEYITANNIVNICSKKLHDYQQRWPAYKKELFGIVYSLRKFHTYVWGRTDLVVHTDHKPLTYIFSSSQLSPALQQWLDVLLDYSFEIRHRDGILNVVPDQLSRMFGSAYSHSPIWGADGSLPSAPIVDHHLLLKGEREASASINNKSSSGSSDIVSSSAASLSNGTASSDTTAMSNSDNNNDSSTHQLLVEVEKRGKICPSSLDERKSLISSAHHFGHFGREAIFRQLWSKGYWWPSIRSDIDSELKSCDPCTRYTVVKAGFHPASSITANGPADHIQVDTSVHLPESPDGYRALLVAIDVFTGFIVLKPLKDTTAETVAKELWDIFAIIGIPKILQSDNGSEFINDVLAALVKITGIEHRFISAYNPRADGKVERSIGTVMSIIKKMLHGTSRYWPLFVSFAQLSFNNKISSLTGSSPFALMFGRTLNELKDYSNDPPTMVPMDDWKVHQEKIASLIYPAISERIKSGKDKMMKAMNEHRRTLLSSSLPVGSTVMIIDPHRQDKFEPKYIGPYAIVRRSHGGAYVLKDPTGDILDRKVPADQIKLVSKKKRDIDDSRPIYIVEKILAHRGTPDRYEYLVKWKDFDEGNNTWEPGSSFLDHNVIRDYWKSIKDFASSQ